MNTIDLARAAGVHPLAMSEEYLPGLERLVALVRAAEREACAKVCVADLIESPTKRVFGKTLSGEE